MIQPEKKGSATMRKARKCVFGVLTLLLATGALAVPAGSASAASDGSGSRSAVEAKKKCKKGFVRKKQRCVKAKKKCKKGFVRKIVRKKQTCVRKRRTAPTRPAPTAPTAPGPTAPTAPGPTAPTARAWDEGRWRGHYAENGVELLFNVLGGRLYTGGFDSFYIEAACSGGSFDPSAIAPVQATIASNGDFAGSGVYSPGFGQQIPWQLSGHISGRSITGGTFTAGPYADFSGNSCSGTTHFTGQWIAAYTL
jgi:hypothetical protein